tara:strand:- start:165 stop:296 length:132 start_codon:yes stop_codon:yes gene_type:complete
MDNRAALKADLLHGDEGKNLNRIKGAGIIDPPEKLKIPGLAPR